METIWSITSTKISSQIYSSVRNKNTHMLKVFKAYISYMYVIGSIVLNGMFELSYNIVEY